MRKLAVAGTTLTMAIALNGSLAQASEDTTLINVGAGVGYLGVVPHEHSPVIGAKVASDTLPTVGIWLYPGAGLTNRIYWAKLFRVSTELGVTRNTISVGGSKVGSVSTIPLNFNLEIHPFPNSRIDPFVGPGFNRTYYTVQDGGLQNFQDFQPRWGALVNGGVDYWVTKALFAEVRVRKLWVNTDVYVKSTGTKIETVRIDPWTFGFSVGYRF